MTITPSSRNAMDYCPPSESQGGWRWLGSAEEVRALAGMDAARLERVRQKQEFLYGGDSWGVAIIRHGYLVREFYTFNVAIPTRFDIWSCTKSFTGTAWGLLLDDSRQGRLPAGKQVDLDSPVYAHLPEGHPLSDPSKERILIRHLLSMTSGIAGEKSGIMGIATATGQGAFEFALGRSPNRHGYWADKLSAEPGAQWDYSDPAFAHLSLLFAHIAGRELADYVRERVLAPIGVENLTWNVQGGSGFLGPHTHAHSGIFVSARELARFGYLMLRNGVWQGRRLMPEWWLELATQPSQEMNPSYGYTWWVNARGALWPTLPRDAYAAMGFRSNKCYVVPSLDLVVARVGSGPVTWDEQLLIGEIAAAIVADD